MSEELYITAWKLRGILTTVARLALPAESQIAWLENNRTAPSLDELALEFDDFYRTAPLLKKAKLLSDDVMARLDAIDAKLERMSDNKTIWRIDSLANSPEWE